MIKIILAASLIVVVLLNVLPIDGYDSADSVQTDMIYVISQPGHLLILIASPRQKQNNILDILRKILSILVFSMALANFLFDQDKKRGQSVDERAWNMPEWLSSLLALIEL